MKHVNTIVAALLGAAAMWLAGPAILATQAAAPTPCPKIAPTLKPTATATPGPGDTGKVQKFGNATITLTKVEFVKSTSIYKAKEGKIFATVEILIESNANVGVTSSFGGTDITDGEGYRYDGSNERSPALPLEENLAKGRKLRGWITFEIPETAKGLVFRYSYPGTEDRPEWQLGR